MSPIPLYHLSPVGRAAIDVESARIRRELADRRAERESRQPLPHASEGRDRPTLPFVAKAEATDPPAHDVGVRP
jgi:hypothetical protein